MPCEGEGISDSPEKGAGGCCRWGTGVKRGGAGRVSCSPMVKGTRCGAEEFK